MVNPVRRVHARWTGAGRVVHVDPRWRGQRARRRAHRSLASGRSGARKLTGGGAIERGKRGELGSGHTGTRAALRMPGDSGAEWGGGDAR
jgi:hypothetical protein